MTILEAWYEATIWCELVHTKSTEVGFPNPERKGEEGRDQESKFRMCKPLPTPLTLLCGELHDLWGGLVVVPETAGGVRGAGQQETRGGVKCQPPHGIRVPSQHSLVHISI